MTRYELIAQDLSRLELEKRYLECRDHLRALMLEHTAMTDAHDAAFRFLMITAPEAE